MAQSRLLPLAFFFMMILALTHPTQAQNSPQDYLDVHNAARQEVGVGPLTWDTTVATYAQNYSNQRQGDCRLQHSSGPYGENLFWGSGREFTAADAVNSWVNEKNDYIYNTNTCAAGKVCGHYTQVVGRNSVRLGCARVKCNSGAIFITCNYDPRGNIVGQRPYPEPYPNSNSTKGNHTVPTVYPNSNPTAPTVFVIRLLSLSN